jgi:hypothetical protein
MFLPLSPSNTTLKRTAGEFVIGNAPDGGTPVFFDRLQTEHAVTQCLELKLQLGESYFHRWFWLRDDITHDASKLAGADAYFKPKLQ